MYLQQLDASANSDYSLWKATKKLKRPKMASPPLRKAAGDWARSDSEKAQTFADHLQKVFSPHPYEGSAEHALNVLSTLNIPTLSQGPTIKKFTKSEVVSTIKRLKNRKASGYDLITRSLLKELSEIDIIYVTQRDNETKLCSSSMEGLSDNNDPKTG